MQEDKIKAISLRIMDNGNTPLGSGFLYLPIGDYAYIFTAAHVITHAGNQTLHIEFYHTDEVEKKEEYQLEIDTNEFKMDLSYHVDGNHDFSPVDIAGVQIEKRKWMNHISCFYLAELLNHLQLFSMGYPRLAHDPEIDFAVHEAKAYVNHFNRNRVQFALQGNYNMADIVNQLSGMSGAGLVINAEGDCECVTGVWTCSQGEEAVGGMMNGITQNAIRNFCQQNNWPVPLLRVVSYKVVDGEEIPVIDDGETYEDLEVRPTTYELTNAHDEHVICLEEIRTNLFELQVDSVLRESNRLLERLDALEEYLFEISKLRIYRATAYLLLQDYNNARSELENADSFSVQEKGLAYIILANISFAEGDKAGAKSYIDTAIESGGERVQALLYEKYLTIMETDGTTYDQDLHELGAVSHDQHMTEREWKQYFQLCSNICILKYGKRDVAIDHLKQSFSITADKSLLLSIAENYQSLTFAHPNDPDIVMADHAVQYYNKYLEYADELLQDQFYHFRGAGYIDLLYLIRDYGRIINCIDRVMGYADEEVMPRFRFIKAHALISLNRYDETLMNQLEQVEKVSLLLHQAFLNISRNYGAYLDAKCGYEYDKTTNGYENAETETILREDGAAFEAEFDRIIFSFIQFLCDGQNYTTPVTVQLKLDILNMCLYMKRGEVFSSLLDECLVQYPDCSGFHNMDRLRSEANNAPDDTERNLVVLLDEDFTYQNIQETISFYLRNIKPEKMISLYKRVLSDREVGRFHRDMLIMGYLSFLSLPKTNDSELVQEYITYRDELSEQQRQQFIDMIREKRGIELPD